MPELISGVDFVSIPTRFFEAAVEFYGATLGLPRSAYHPERGLAEFETGNLTLSIIHAEGMGMEFHRNRNPIALHVADVAAGRAELESRGVSFHGDIIDTSVCYMALFSDPDGNSLMLHHRYAPRVSEIEG